MTIQRGHLRGFLRKPLPNYSIGHAKRLLLSEELHHFELGLSAAVGRRNASKVGRVLDAPAKALGSVILRLSGMTQTVRASTFWGEQMEVVIPEPVSTMIHRFGYYDESVCRYMIECLRPGDVVADVGAHFGFFSLLASALTAPNGHVVSFEPMPRTNARLRRNLAGLEGQHRATVVDFAAFDETRLLEFRDFGDAHSSFNSAFLGRGVKHQGNIVPVQGRPFDDVWTDLDKRKLDFVKIDAESAELNVLRGMERTLAKSRPVVIAEFGDFDLPGVASSATTAHWLTSHNYVAYEWTANGLVRHELLDRYPYTNLAFFPSERPPR